MLPFCGDWRAWAGATGGASRSVSSRPGAPHRCGVRLIPFRRQGCRCCKVTITSLSCCDCTCLAGVCADQKCGRQRVASLRVDMGPVFVFSAPSTGSHWLVVLICGLLEHRPGLLQDQQTWEWVRPRALAVVCEAIKNFWSVQLWLRLIIPELRPLQGLMGKDQHRLAGCLHLGCLQLDLLLILAEQVAPCRVIWRPQRVCHT